MESAPLEEILAVSREALASSRELIAGTDTEAAVDASLKDFLLRVVAELEVLCDRAPDGDAELRIFSFALETFMPVLDLDWMPDDMASFTPQMTQREQECVAMLRFERQAQAAGRQEKPAGGRWSGLLDLISETIELCMVFGYREGVERCFALNEMLGDLLGEARE